MYICILYSQDTRYTWSSCTISLFSTGSCLCDHSLAQDSRIISDATEVTNPIESSLSFQRVWRAVRNFLGVEPSCRLHCHLCPLTIQYPPPTLPHFLFSLFHFLRLLILWYPCLPQSAKLLLFLDRFWPSCSWVHQPRQPTRSFLDSQASKVPAPHRISAQPLRGSRNKECNYCAALSPELHPRWGNRKSRFFCYPLACNY